VRFVNPEAFWILIVILPAIYLYVRREKKSLGAIKFSDISALKKIKPTLAVKLRHLLFVGRIVGLTLLVVALARPQKGTSFEEITTEGVDIMLVLDVSSSMQALDFKPKDRLNVAKEQIIEFVSKREHDRMGLVLFAGRSYTKCPLTLDYDLLTKFVDEVDFGQIESENRTAIGTAIATAANRLKESSTKSKMMILLTDGSNNAGDISPEIAATASAQLGIKIYTIAIGKEGEVPYPVIETDPFTGKKKRTVRKMKSDIDVTTLQKVAKMTDGQFFRAENRDELKNIYEIIDRLEKTEIKSRQYTSWNELFFNWLIAGFVLLFIEFLLRHTRFRRIP
jgi:Ca-activated chloride channel family protein